MTAAASPAGPGQPGWIEPELATLTKDRFSSPSWMYERKLDGERCLAYRDGPRLRLMTRNHKDVTSNYPELAGAFRAQRATDFIVDGEIVAFTGPQTSFERLQQRMGVADPPPELLREVPVQLYLFDLVWADGADLRPRPLLERKQRLHDLLSFAGPLHYTEHRVGDGEAYLAEACRQGLGRTRREALVPPLPGGPEQGLAEVQVRELAQEFVVGGFTDRKGTRTGLGALLIGYYDTDRQLVYAGKVGTGFDQRMLPSCCTGRLTALEQDRPPFDHGKLPRSGVHWVQPRLVAEVGLQRMDHRRGTAPPAVPGPARRQGPRRRRPGDAAAHHPVKTPPHTLTQTIAGYHPGRQWASRLRRGTGGQFAGRGLGPAEWELLRPGHRAGRCPIPPRVHSSRAAATGGRRES